MSIIPLINSEFYQENSLNIELKTEEKSIKPIINNKNYKENQEPITIEINKKPIENNPIINKDYYTSLSTDPIIIEMVEKGEQGPVGPIGLTGNGIDRIEKTSTSGIIDIYTIFFTNGETFEYQITNGVVYYYDGDYLVTPMPYSSQILPTANLVMSDNVNIQEIPYYEVSNSSGGKTVTIGDI